MTVAAPRSVLFLCVANSARSQMAEGLARAAAPAGTRVASAGSSPAFVHPAAVEAMGELGIDLTAQRSKSVNELDPAEFEVVVTLCADEVCPVTPPGTRRIHWPLPDPAAVPPGEERRRRFRAVRDEIARRLEEEFGWTALEGA